MNIRRLNILADFLETVPPARFNIAAWEITPAEAECGFAGCALGWATKIPAFQAEGLHMHNPGTDYAAPEVKDESGHEARGFSCAQTFFELSDWQADHLFYGVTYPNYEDCPPTPADVVVRIREMVAGASVVS